MISALGQCRQTHRSSQWVAAAAAHHHHPALTLQTHIYTHQHCQHDATLINGRIHQQWHISSLQDSLYTIAGLKPHTNGSIQQRATSLTQQCGSTAARSKHTPARHHCSCTTTTINTIHISSCKRGLSSKKVCQAHEAMPSTEIIAPLQDSVSGRQCSTSLVWRCCQSLYLVGSMISVSGRHMICDSQVVGYNVWYCVLWSIMFNISICEVPLRYALSIIWFQYNWLCIIHYFHYMVPVQLTALSIISIIWFQYHWLCIIHYMVPVQLSMHYLLFPLHGSGIIDYALSIYWLYGSSTIEHALSIISVIWF